ncbi:MAG: hypothetical protein AAB834_05345 [Patescibacteria group bacterium]
MSIKHADPFYRKLYALLIGLSVLCLLLVGLTWLQGPRIRLASIDTEKAATQAGQRLILHTNQPLGTITKDQVTISPDTPIEISGNGNTNIVQFKQRLAYQTTYTVTLTSGKHRLKYAFTTAKPAIYYAEQNVTGTADVIRRNVLGTDKDEIVYNAEEILDFAVLSDSLIICTRNTDYTNNLIKLDLKTKKETAIKLPKPGTVAHMYSAPDKQSFGFSFSPKSYEKNLNSALFLVHSTDLRPRLVKSFANKPLQILDWKFAPDSATILAQLPDTTTLITDSRTGKPPTPLGQYPGIGGFSADGAKVIMQDKDGPLVIDLKTNTQTRLAQKEVGSDSFVTSTLPFHNQEGFLMNGQAFVGSYYLDYIQIQSEGTQTMLHQTGKTEGIIATELSPNDQYAALIISEPQDGIVRLEARVIKLQTGKIDIIPNATKIHW